MIKERAAVSRVKEIVAKRVLLRELAFRHAGRIEITEDEAGVVAPRYKLVEVAELRLERRVVDLQLLMIKAMHDVASFRVCADVIGEVVRNEGQRDVVVGPKRQISIRARRKIWIGLAIQRPRCLVN